MGLITMPNEEGSRILKQAAWKARPCPSCGQEKLQMYVRGHYVSTLTIPILPSGKNVGAVCENCHHHIEEHHFPNEDKILIDQLKKTSSYPKKWYGLIYLIPIFVIGFVVLILSDSFFETDLREYLDDPQVNDVYVIYQPTEYPFNHTCWKLREVRGDTLFVSANAYNYSGIPNQLDREDGFTQITFEVTMSSLRSMLEDNRIRDIKRGYSKWSRFGKDFDF